MRLFDQVLLPIRVAANLGKNISENPFTRRQAGRAWLRFARWQTVQRLSGDGILVPFVNELVIEAVHGRAASTGVVYLGLPEPESMSFFAHVLRPGDRFIDIGANVGTYSVLAAGIEGCEVIAAEPIPETFRLLKRNLAHNRLEGRIIAKNVAVSAHAGVVRMTDQHDSTNHVLDRDTHGGIEIPSVTLDELAVHDRPTFLKLDVEGHEISVISGAGKLLKNPCLRAIAMEFGCGAHRGIDEKQLYREVLSHGFESVRYDPERRAIEPCDGGPGRHGNTLFVRGLDEISERVRSAPPIRVLGTAL
jgi:FkbM family methyltransferase